MKTVEKALTIYTDKIQAHEHIDLNELCAELSDDDRAEFYELKDVIDILWQDKNASKFDKLFDNLWDQWSSYYDMPEAANYRKEHMKDSDWAAEDAIDKLLDEVLNEDE
jgi:hypothetical protein